MGTQDGRYRHIKGPAVEIVSLAGEVRASGDGSLKAALSGVVADTDGNVFGGPFVAGSQSDLHDVRGHARGMAARLTCWPLARL